MEKPKICKRCVMDTSAKGIKFDSRGYCNYCEELKLSSNEILFDKALMRERLKKLTQEIKNKRTNKTKYDCIVGLSGGVDSSWALVQAIKCGLNPLAVHFDNGWNSELAQNNINNIVKSLNVDLYTHVVDWNEYKNLMNAFFAANVIDIELLYDNSMLSLNYSQAKIQNTSYILAGSNVASEGMRIPENWNWYKYDKKNIISINKKHSNYLIKTLPMISTYGYVYYKFFKKIKWINFLDLLDYNKSKAVQILEKEYNFKSYPYKHYESIFTRFYQGYLLPKKFGVDKRKIHFSNLIIFEQFSRKEALYNLSKNEHGYDDKNALNDDIEYFLKKMDWDYKKFNDYINEKPVSHNAYNSEFKMYKRMNKFYKYLKNEKR